MKPTQEKWNKIRIKLIGCIFAIAFVTILCRAYYLQIITTDEWVKRAERQHQKTVQLTPARGNISDRNGLPLAVSIEMDSCFAEPKVIENIPETAAKLAPLLGNSRQELEKKLTDNKQKHFVWLMRRRRCPSLIMSGFLHYGELTWPLGQVWRTHMVMEAFYPRVTERA